MKERPILFSAPMIRAILSGTKTQTRRVVKPQPPMYFDRHCWFDAPVYGWTREPEPATDWHKVKCPYGKLGDRLWVRETFSTSGLTKYHETGKKNDHGGPGDPCCAFAATGTYKCGKRIPDAALATGSHKWKPSIFMPRWASRITLEITEVRVQRLVEISFEDCLCEGVVGTQQWKDVTVDEIRSGSSSISPEDVDAAIDAGWNAYARSAYQRLWDSINGKKAPWDSNPWIWALTFKLATDGGRDG